MIIWGSRGITSNAGQGQFHCPRCGDQQRYDRKLVRRFFTLYFIPLFPTETLGEYVECSACRATYELEVLEYDPQREVREFLAEFEHAILRVMVHMVLADGVVADEEVAAVQAIYANVADRTLEFAVFKAEVARAEIDPQSLTRFLSEVAGRLNDHGKELVIKAAFFVALSDGEFADEERAYLVELAQAMELSDAHLKGILASLLEAEADGSDEDG